MISLRVEVVVEHSQKAYWIINHFDN